MKKHSSYKPSGIEWLETIPENWEVSKLKYLGNLFGGLTGKSGVDFNNEENPKNKPYIPYTNIFNNTYISKDHFHYVSIDDGESQNRIKKYDMFFLMSSETHKDLGKSCILIDDVDELYLNSFCKGYRVKDKNIQPLFLNYQILGHLHSEMISVEGKGFTRINLRQDKINDLIVFYPPLQEQEQIVKYLDEKTTIIDKLISTKQRKVEILKEQRTTLINQVITKGLNPNVKMKDSGLEWIGGIPENWKSCNLRYVLELLTDFESNGSFSSVKENVKVDDEGEVWYVRMTDLENNNLRNEKCKYCDLDTYNFLHKTKVFGGELLITKRGQIGKVYLFPYNCGLSTLGPNSYLLRLKNIVNSHFLYFFYISDIGQTTLKLLDNSTTIGSLYKDDIKGSIVIIPPIKEQLQIVKHLDFKTKEIDDLVSLEQKKIELLKEYRQSLISEVITGKIKVV
jgi:type I restriction enzyme S subunit